MNHLPANLAALESATGRKVDLPANEGLARVEWMQGVAVLTLADAAGGPRVAVNSRRDPVAEAQRTLDAVLEREAAPPGTIVCLGLGLGYVLDAVERRCPDAKIVALEPEPSCVAALLEHRNLAHALAGGRLLLLWGPDYYGADGAWRFLDGSGKTPPVVVHAALARRDPHAFQNARAVVERMVFGALANAEARRRFAGRYLLNTLKNLPAIARSADVGVLFGKAVGRPGIVISAGPSLDRNIEGLRQVVDRAVLVAVDTALRPLLTGGIHPHFTVAVDPSETNGRHLRDLPDTAGVHLVAEGSIEPGAFAEFGDRIFTFKVSDHAPWPWLSQQDLGRSTLRAWGSVATSALDLAVRMGCNPIVFVGQDLGFTDTRPYCRDTTFEEEWARPVSLGLNLSKVWRLDVARRQPSDELDLRGVATPFTGELRAFRDWLLEQFRSNPDRTFLNATGAGFLFGAGVSQASVDGLRQSASTPLATPSGATECLLAGGRGVNAAALAESLAKAWHGEPGQEWVRFAHPSASPEQIGAVVEDTCQRLQALGATMPRSAGTGDPRPGEWPSAWRAPERAAVVRAVRWGAAIPSWVVMRPGHQGAGPFASSASAYRRLLRLFRRSELLTGTRYLPTPIAGTSWPPELVPSVVFPWAPEALRDVRRFEEDVASVAATRRLTSTVELPPAPVPSTKPLGTAGPRDVEQPHLDEKARCSVAAVFVDLLRYRGRSAPLDGLSRLLRDGSLPDDAAAASREAKVTLTRVSRGRPRHRPLELTWHQDPAAVAYLTRGVIQEVGSRPVGDRLAQPHGSSTAPVAVRVELPALPLDGSRGAVLEPNSRSCDRLVPLALRAGLGPAAIVTPFDEGHVLVTRLHTNDTCRVAEDGSWSVWQRWPSIIIGAIPWGTEGGRLAWHNGTERWPLTAPYLLWQPAREAPIARIDLPFRPNAGVCRDGRMYWVSHEGGVGIWSPGEGSRLVHEELPLIGITAGERGLELDPLVPDERSLTWPEHSWRWSDGGAPSPTPVGPLGSRTAWATAGAWTASAHPYAGVVDLRGPEGRHLQLHCHHVFTLAWAGSSLVVGTLESETFVFRGLASRLAQLRSDTGGVA